MTKTVVIEIPEGKTVRERTMVLQTDKDTGKQRIIVGYVLND